MRISKTSVLWQFIYSHVYQYSSHSDFKLHWQAYVSRPGPEPRYLSWGTDGLSLADVLECLLHPQMVHSIVVSTVVCPQVLGLVCQHNTGNEACIRRNKAHIDDDEEYASACVIVDLLLLGLMPEWQNCVENEQPWGDGMVYGPHDGDAQGPYKLCPSPNHEEAIHNTDCTHQRQKSVHGNVTIQDIARYSLTFCFISAPWAPETHSASGAYRGCGNLKPYSGQASAI